MIDLGLIQKEPDPEVKSKKRVSLSEHGLTLLREIEQEFCRLFDVIEQLRRERGDLPDGPVEISPRDAAICDPASPHHRIAPPGH